MLRPRTLSTVAALVVAAATVARGAVFTVANTNAEGPGTLRRALIDLDADVDPDADTIVFAIPGAGVPVIVPNTVLEIRKAVLIDGTTQQPAGRVELRGGQDPSPTDGLVVTGSGVTIRGLILTGFAGAAIRLDGGGDGAVIDGNRIGTDASGTQAAPNGIGILVRTQDNRIGGTTAAARNVVSGNGAGIFFAGDAAGTRIVGNFVGTDAAGTAPLPNQRGIVVGANVDGVTIGGLADGEGNLVSGNSGDGITIAQGCDDLAIEGNRIGTDAAGVAAVPNLRGIAKLGRGTNRVAGNVVSGNTGDGVVVDGANGGLTLHGNLIGTDAGGTTPVPNGAHGVFLVRASGHQVGGTGEGEGNTIAFNTSAGIAVGTNSVENAIRGNALHDNGGLGIDLGDDGVTPYDALDADNGPNRLQNFPVPDAGVFPGGSTVMGTLHAKPGVHYQLDFFASAACDPSGHGEGEVHVGFETTTTDQDGNSAFSIELFRFVDPGQIITATATDPDGNTSELSPCSASPPTTTTTSTTTTSTITTTTSTTTTSTTSTTVTTTTSSLSTTLPPTTVTTTTTTSSTRPVPTTAIPACTPDPLCPPACGVDATFFVASCRLGVLRDTIGALQSLGRFRNKTEARVVRASADFERAKSSCMLDQERPARSALGRAIRQLRMLANRLGSRPVMRAIGEDGPRLAAEARDLAGMARGLRRVLSCP